VAAPTQRIFGAQAVLGGAAAVAVSLAGVDVLAAFTSGETSDRLAYLLVGAVGAPVGAFVARRAAADRDSASLAAALIVVVLIARRTGDVPGTGALGALLALAAWRLAPARVRAAAGFAAWRPEAVIAAIVLGLLLVLEPNMSVGAWLRAGVATGAIAVLLSHSYDGRRRRLADGLAVGALILGLSDLSVVTDPAEFAFSGQGHHNFFVAPVNDVLHGRPLLVDTVPQYGPGMTAFMAGVFSFVPLGYGTFGLVTMALTAVGYAALYALLRVAGAGPVLATVGIAGTAALCLYSSFASPVDIPSTVGPRHLPGYAVALTATLAFSASRSASRWRAAALGTLAVAGAWSFEAAAFSLAAWTGAAAVSRCAGSNWYPRALLRDAATGLAAVLAGAAVLSLGVFLWTGAGAAWGDYLSYADAYNSWAVFATAAPAWSPLLLVGAVYLLSAVGVAARTGETPAAGLVAVGAMTVLGAATASYAVSRSDEFAVLAVATPAAIVCLLWIAVALREGRPSARTAVAAAVVPALLIGAGWNGANLRVHDTIPGLSAAGPSALADALRKSWDPPPVIGASVEVQRIIGAEQRPPVLLLTDDLQVEALMRARRVNALPVSHPLSDALLPGRLSARLRSAIEGLSPCTLVVTEDAPKPGPPEPGSPHRLAVLARRLVIRRLNEPAIEELTERFRFAQVRRRSNLITARLQPLPGSRSRAQPRTTRRSARSRASRTCP
jgi:hypothetical protein